jgi:hypothetical protein
VLSKGKAAAVWPISLIKEETLKLFRDARQTKAQIQERTRSLTKGAEESAGVDWEKGSPTDQREHDHREYFSNLIAESNKKSGLGAS